MNAPGAPLPVFWTARAIHELETIAEVLRWAGQERGALALKWAELNERD